MISYGALIAILILISDNILKRKKIKFRLYLMPIAVGIYLPFSLSTPILIGGLISYFVLNKKESKETAAQNGVLLSSGLIAGESLMGIFIAFLVSLGIMKINGIINESLMMYLTTIICSSTLFWFIKNQNNLFYINIKSSSYVIDILYKYFDESEPTNIMFLFLFNGNENLSLIRLPIL